MHTRTTPTPGDDSNRHKPRARPAGRRAAPRPRGAASETPRKNAADKRDAGHEGPSRLKAMTKGVSGTFGDGGMAFTIPVGDLVISISASQNPEKLR